MVKKSFQFALPCLLFLAAAAGCGKNQDAQNNRPAQASPPSSQGSASSLTNWQKFSSPEGKFSVLLPGTPKERQEGAQTPFGLIVYHAFAATQDAHHAYGAGYYDLSNNSDAQSFLDRIQSLIIGPGKIMSSHNLQIAGYPGREFEFGPDQQGNYSARVRLVLVGQRIYVLTAIFLKSEPHPQECSAFFDSFSLQQ